MRFSFISNIIICVRVVNTTLTQYTQKEHNNMKINIPKLNARPYVKVGDVLVTQSGRKILLVKSETDKILALDLEENTLVRRAYDDVEDFLKNYSFNYIVYSAENIELEVKGVGKKWR